MSALPMAFFLACSWFWCIGGFFPVLLAQEFGATAVMFFMLVNVVGATAFGFVWDEPARRRFLDRYRLPVNGFSVLVIGYHVVFMAWLSTMLGTPLPLVAFLVVTGLFALWRQRLAGLAVVLFIVTVALFAVVLTHLPADMAGQATGRQPLQPFTHQILPLALGFFLAPYFDLTFHRAFAESRLPPRVFLLGLGLLFTVLLVGMALAVPAFALLTTADSLSGPALSAVVAILVMQTAFTTAAHFREVAGTEWLRGRNGLSVLIGVVVLSGLHAVVGVVMPSEAAVAGELVYRMFLFLIGVLFPVILLFGGVNRQSVLAMVFLTPCYTLGFLIGGAYAPFLSVGMVGLAAMIWLRFRAVPSRQS